MKILIISSELNNAGGHEKIICSLSNSLISLGFRITILISGGTLKTFYALHSSVNLELLNKDFGFNRERNYFEKKIDFISSLKLLNAQIKKIQPDIIINTEYVFQVATVLIRAHKKFKVISWYQTLFTSKKSSVWEYLFKFTSKKVHAIVVANSTEQNQFLRLNSNCIVIPNYTDIVTSISDCSKKRILTISQLQTYKGIDLLLKTAKIILTKYPQWQWKLIGKGYQESDVLATIKNAQLEGKLILQKPASPNLEAEYLNASIYVKTSRQELFGLVLIEAMSYGLPCIAFDCPTGPRHIINDGKNGFLVENENPEKLAEAISCLIEDEEKRKTMGISAKQNIHIFYSENVIPKWTQLLDKLVSNSTT